MGTAIALAVRLVLPLAILRWPLPGALLAIATDTLDIVIFNIWGFPSWEYQQLDKVLDLYYLALEAIVAQRWAPLERGTASGLFAYRLVGIVLFEITGARWLLLAFPNLFEMFFVFVLVVRRFAPAYQLMPARVAAWLTVLLVPKLAQEYLLHSARVLDDLVLFDVVGDAWRRISPR